MKKSTKNYLLSLLMLVGFSQLKAGNPEVFFTSNALSEQEKVQSADSIVTQFYNTLTTGFQQSGLPRFIIAGRERKFLFGIGGFVNFRTAYQFNGIVDNLDMVTYDIPIPGDYATKKEFNMDASISRLYFKAIANTKKLGQVISYIEADFRGSDQTFGLRLAYISFKGVLFGRDFTTFCDLDASPITVDFEGPNSYNANFNEMIRYTYKTPNQRWKFGVALEMPSLSATVTDNLKTIPQSMGDVPLYAQYNWGKNKSSHLRISGVFRDLEYYNVAESEDKSALGWGVQLTGQIHIGNKITTYFQGIYGEGITPYIQDLTGSGLDLVANPNNENELQTLPMKGCFGAVQYNFSKKVFCSGGYGITAVDSRNGYEAYAPESYKSAQYIFGNIFFNINSSCQVALEYLYGTRENMNKEQNQANRIQAMVQYNF